MREGDSEFIESYLAGDEAAAREMDQLIRGIASSYRRKLAHRWDDVLQEIHLEVFKLLEKRSFRGEAKLRTYLWRVVNHTCLDHLRSQQRWQWTELEEFGEVQEFAELRAEQGELSAEAADLLTRVLERVARECREIWQLLFQGLSYREMSRQTGVKSGALRVRALRCRKKALEIRQELIDDM